MDRNPKDIVGGSLLVLLGLYVALAAFGFGIGSPSRMGAGFYPLILGCAAILAGACIVFAGFQVRADLPQVAWATFALVVGGLVAFLLLVERAGLIPAIWGLVGLSAMADRDITIAEIAALALAASLLAWLAFVKILQLPLSGVEGLF